MRALDKKQLRKKMLEQREDLPATFVADKSSLIIRELESSKEFQEAKAVAVFVSYRKEVDTHSLIKKYLDKKQILVPKIVNKEIIFCWIKSFEELSANKLGICEPVTNRIITKEAIDLIVVPLLAYDKDNYRLGYGGGYYDKYLSDYAGTTIGITYRCQKVAKIPRDNYDIPLQIIIAK